MSITFTAELVDPVGYVIGCCETSAQHQPRYGTYDDAVSALQDFELAHMISGAELRPLLPGCDIPEVCPEYDRQVFPVEADPAPEVRVTQVNAAAILAALGYPVPNVPDAFAEVDLAGIADPAEFEGRALIALAVAPVDAGMPDYDDTQAGGPRWIVAARRPGYLQEKLEGLCELARWCGERGRRVQWA